MASRITDKSGRLIQFGRRIGAGGEGEVYEIADNPIAVAKIYHQPLLPERAAKIEAMMLMGTSGVSDFCAWPTDIIIADRKPHGLIMPYVKGRKEIHLLHGPKSRKAEFPDAGFGFLIRVATNIARAVANLHGAGVVIGDINDRGFLAGRDGMVSLIDCDSFQITAPRQTHFCDVGVPNFTPPELQGQNLRGVRRTAEQDAFGLAVLLFLLIFMGRHPFAGRSRNGTIELEAAIQQYRYAYSSDCVRTGLEPPPNTISIAHGAGGEMAQLFERAFSPDAVRGATRPTAAEWVAALQRLEGNLGPCQWNRAHVFAKGQTSCPWCLLEQRSGVDLFTFIPNDDDPASAVDVEAFWKALGALVPPPVPNLKAPVASSGYLAASLPAEVRSQIDRYWSLKFEADRARSVASTFDASARQQDTIADEIVQSLGQSNIGILRVETALLRIGDLNGPLGINIISALVFLVSATLIAVSYNAERAAELTLPLFLAFSLMLVAIVPFILGLLQCRRTRLIKKLTTLRTRALDANPATRKRLETACVMQKTMLDQAQQADAVAVAMANDVEPLKAAAENECQALLAKAERKLSEAEAHAKHAKARLNQMATVARSLGQELDARRKSAEQSVLQWRSLNAKRSAELKGLLDDERIDQLESYLDTVFISPAGIKGITRALKTTLHSYNIETAADVTHTAVSDVPGFGAVRTKTMVDWRAGVARGFKYVPGKGVDPAKRAAVERKHLTERRRVERDLKTLCDDMLSKVSELSLAMGHAKRVADEAGTAFAHAQADRKALGLAANL